MCTDQFSADEIRRAYNQAPAMYRPRYQWITESMTVKLSVAGARLQSSARGVIVAHAHPRMLRTRIRNHTTNHLAQDHRASIDRHHQAQTTIEFSSHEEENSH